MNRDDVLRIAELHDLGHFYDCAGPTWGAHFASEAALLAFARQVEAEIIERCAKVSDRFGSAYIAEHIRALSSPIEQIAAEPKGSQILCSCWKCVTAATANQITDARPRVEQNLGAACHEVATPGTNAGEKQ